MVVLIGLRGISIIIVYFSIALHLVESDTLFYYSSSVVLDVIYEDPHVGR